MVKGALSCIKYIMFAFNFLFVISGLALVVVGGISTQKDFTKFEDNKYLTAPIIIIVVGFVTFFIAFLGCCGALQENYLMVILFALFLMLLIIAEIAGVTFAFLHKSEMKSILKKNMNASLVQQKEDATAVLNALQKRLACCGVEGPQDYTSNKLSIPQSCCPDSSKSCEEGQAHKSGCFEKLFEEKNIIIAAVGGVAGAFTILQILGSVFACCLASAIKKDKDL